jgi:hypothetical protein
MMRVPFSIFNVGWGEPAPIAALILSIHYANTVDVSPWLLAVMAFGFLAIHWFMHSVVGCGGGTWRSMFRSACALTLYMSVSVRVTNKANFAMATILVSTIICSLDTIESLSKSASRKWSWQCVLCGLVNWGAIISLLVASSSGNHHLNAYSFFYKTQHDDDGGGLWNWACLVFAVDLLTCPLQDMSVRKGLIWQVICSICLPIIVLMFQNSGGARGTITETLAYFLVFPSILLAQRKLYWHWIKPLIVVDNNNCGGGDSCEDLGCNGDDARSNDDGDGIRVIYSVACCGAMALCLVVYKPLEITLLFVHFSLHWLAHVCRGLAVLLLPHGEQK